MREDVSGRTGATTFRGATDEIFGRWPAWPWSVIALIVGGSIVGAAAAGPLRAAGVASPAALGTFACAGYGLVAAAFLALLPRVGRLVMLQPGASRRPAAVGEGWWPMRLLPAALATTPTLRRTPEEFTAAVASTAREVRNILADRLWPVWAAAFVAPVLGLLTAWQNGETVQLRLQSDAGSDTVLPALISEVSPPMVTTIAASLALMLAVVVVDQWTKSLLRRWSGVVEPADGDHAAVAGKLALDRVSDRIRLDREANVAPPLPPEPPAGKLATHHLDPAELDRLWKQSQPREGR